MFHKLCIGRQQQDVDNRISWIVGKSWRTTIDFNKNHERNLYDSGSRAGAIFDFSATGQTGSFAVQYGNSKHHLITLTRHGYHDGSSSGNRTHRSATNQWDCECNNFLRLRRQRQDVDNHLSRKSCESYRRPLPSWSNSFKRDIHNHRINSILDSGSHR